MGIMIVEIQGNISNINNKGSVSNAMDDYLKGPTTQFMQCVNTSNVYCVNGKL